MILTIGPGGCGFTFLNWTIRYLRGDTVIDYYGRVIDNPIVGHVAHGYQKTHANHITSADKIPLLDTVSEDEVVFIVVDQPRTIEKLAPYLKNKRIVFNPTGYEQQVFTRLITSQNGGTSYYNNFLDTLKVDKSLAIECLHDYSKKLYVDLTSLYSSSFVIQYNDVFEELDQHIVDIFDYLELEIVPDRFDKWKPIYNTYRNNNRQIVFESAYTPHQKLPVLKKIIEWKNSLFQM